MINALIEDVYQDSRRQCLASCDETKKKIYQDVLDCTYDSLKKRRNRQQLAPMAYRDSTNKLREKYFDYNSVSPDCSDNSEKIT
jgi:hypothetical protein